MLLKLPPLPRKGFWASRALFETQDVGRVPHPGATPLTFTALSVKCPVNNRIPLLLAAQKTEEGCPVVQIIMAAGARTGGSRW